MAASSSWRVTGIVAVVDEDDAGYERSYRIRSPTCALLPGRAQAGCSSRNQDEPRELDFNIKAHPL